MKRYCFEFEFDDNDFPYGIKMGCGVTAFDQTDAIELMKTRVLKGESVPKIKKMIENVDISSLDALHIQQNMAPPNIRGIWFPIGYSVGE
jgi:hypothetical protein